MSENFSAESNAPDRERWVTIDLNDNARWGRVDRERMGRYDPATDPEPKPKLHREIIDASLALARQERAKRRRA